MAFGFNIALGGVFNDKGDQQAEAKCHAQKIKGREIETVIFVFHHFNHQCGLNSSI